MSTTASVNVAAPLPSGAVTFLFTDVEGSTGLWERDAQGMQAALVRHNECLRDAIASFGGSVVKGTGDGVLAVFAQPADALQACIAAQRALQRTATEAAARQGDRAPIVIKVRMGLHTGIAELSDGDYFGMTLNRAARIMAAAHGEQILVSATTAELASSHVGADITLRDMGEHRLKGIAKPERLLQVVSAHLRSDFPPLSSQVNYTLPAERDAFVGRRESLEALARRFAAGARLVSILGLGGTGKTRLVTRFGWSAMQNYPGGVWFCDLAAARSLDGILHAVAQGLDVPLGNEAVVQLGDCIAGRGRCLVILDNFEQVSRFAEETVGDWLQRARDACFLVTTREVLGIAGEDAMPLAPLHAAEAEMLFRTRAESSRPGFVPSGDDEAAIPALIKLLEGLPLAIELAAARVRVMPPRTLLQRMTERFKVLSSIGSRLDRQATLRAVFDWSWDLLTLPEKAALAQLSVFEGGFSLAAVEAVIDLSTCADAPWPMDVLQSLVQKSLVRQARDDRFDLLVSVQEYAGEHLRTDGRYDGSGPEALLDAQIRHGRYFATLPVDEQDPQASMELDNLVAACRRAVVRQDTDVAIGALEGAGGILQACGPFNVAVELAAAVGSLSGLDAAAAARVDLVAGRALDSLGRHAEAVARVESCVTRARDGGDRQGESRALILQGFIETMRGQFDRAERLLDAAAPLVAKIKDARVEGRLENAQATLDLHRGKLESSLPHYESAVLLGRRTGDRQLEATALCNLGTCYQQLGIRDKSEASQEAGLALSRTIGNRRIEGNILSNLGLLKWEQGKLPEALEFLEPALALAREIGNRQLEAVAHCNLGMVHHDLAHLEDARRHFEAALDIVRELGDRRRQGQFLSYLGLLHAHCNAFDEARRCLDESEALLRSADPLSLAVLLCKRAEAEHLAGCAGAAREAAREARGIAEDLRAGEDSELGIALARVQSLIGATAGSAASA